MAMLVTHLSAAAGCLTWMAAEWIRFGKPSVLGIVTGMVAGLGTITPASGFVGPGGAIVIGFLAGAICFTGDSLLTLKDGSSVTFHDLEVSELSELSGWVGSG